MSSNLVIVAIPQEGDRVWKVSSEKVPHLTILHLGDSAQVSNLDQIVQFVEHAVNTSLNRFWLPVDRRGELGADKADVLFFKKGRYDFKAVHDFRSLLLQNSNIKSAYDASQQFETPTEVGEPGQPWIPHLTLGYPTSPAKELDNDYDGRFYDVSFDRIAVWPNDFEGPEFSLKDQWDEWDEMDSPAVAMSSPDEHKVTIEEARKAMGLDTLEHHGVKGMRWGVRKEDVSTTAKSALTVAKKSGGAVGRAARGVVNVAGDIQFENKVADGRARDEIIDHAADNYRKSDLPALKERHGDYGKLTKRVTKPFSKEARAYRKDARETYIKRLETSANSMKNFSGDREYTIRERGIEQPAEGGKLPSSQYYWDVSTRQVRHAGEADFSTVQVTLDDEGYISDIKRVEKSMAQSTDTFIDDFLEHYGVKGMRWGVRKPPPAAVSAKATSKVPQGSKRKTKIQVEGGQNHDASEDAIRVAEARAKLQKSGTHALSNAELRDVANRLQLEQQVRQLNTPASRKFVSGFLKNQGQQGAQSLAQKGRKAALGF